MKILIIEQNGLWSDFQRENRERFWIKELRVLHPDGIRERPFNLKGGGVWFFSKKIFLFPMLLKKIF
jgi:hypothetical protein